MGGAMSSDGSRDVARHKFDWASGSRRREDFVHLPPSFSSPTSPLESSEARPSIQGCTKTSTDGIGQSRKRRQLKSSTCEATDVLLDVGWPRDVRDGEGGDSAAPETRRVGTQPLLTAALAVVLLSDWIPLGSVKQLQLASVSVCRDCRETTAFHVRVTLETPRRLWTETRRWNGCEIGGGGGAGLATVPGVRTERLTFGERYEGAVDKVRWPARLKHITFGKEFNQPVDGIAWPGGLRGLEFGYTFDQPIEAAAFPPGLRSLRFGVMFNQDLADVHWPPELKHLIFGCQFDRTLEHTRLSRGLETLEVGCRWNSPLALVDLPDSMVSLCLGYDFNQPLQEVRWPATLTHLSLGDSFDQPLARVSLPAALRSIEIGDAFDRPLEGVGWPAGLERAAFGASMSVCFAMFVVWPASMAELTVGGIVLERPAIFFVDRAVGAYR